MHKTRIFFWIEIMCVLICTASCEFKCGSEGVELKMDRSGDALRAHQEGLKLLQAHNPEAAAAKFSEAMNLAPGEAAPVVGLCQAHAMGPDMQQAEKSCLKALKADSQNPEVYYQLASIHIRNDDLPNAQRYLEAALDLDPEYDSAMAAMGVVLMQQGEFKKAEGVLKKAAALSPRNKSVHHNLALCLINQKKCEEAGPVSREAEKLGDDLLAINSAYEKYCSLPEPPEGMMASRIDDRVFFMDRRSANGLEYSKCVDRKICKRPPYDKFNREGEYRTQPAMSVNWHGADAYCRWKGKRLPALAEYEASWKKLDWRGCCARGVIPREWTSDDGDKEGTKFHVRKHNGALNKISQRKSRGVDSSTVRCAMDP